jgi:hypothetical protein
MEALPTLMSRLRGRFSQTQRAVQPFWAGCLISRRRQTAGRICPETLFFVFAQSDDFQ